MTTSTKTVAVLSLFAGACSDVAGPGEDCTTYSCIVLADAPVAYWRFEESSGTVAADSSGQSHSGAYVNGPALGDSLGATSTGRAVLIANPNEGVEVGGASWTNLSPFTVEAWVRPTAVTSAEGMIIVDKGAVWNLFLDPQGRPAFQRPGDVPPETLAPTAATIGQVYHLVGTFQNGVMTLYVNGAQVSQGGTAVTTMPGNTEPIHLGRGLSPGQYGFEGVIDEVALYDKVLSAQAILAHYNAGL